MMRVRRNVYELPSGDTTLYWYERAVAAMQQRPASDPTSWTYQAAVHGTTLPTNPTNSDYWNQCQHATWFFLPWHRMYVYLFEQIVLKEIVNQGGPSDWALPYWNYSENNARYLPPAFRDKTLADGQPNHLYIVNRDEGFNAGTKSLDSKDVNLAALNQPTFSGTQGFGGNNPNDPNNDSTSGQLEKTPHNAVHVAVGGSGGWMSRFTTAALDPIFWLHHANVDRLWEVWLKRDATHQNPTDQKWLNVSFSFHDASGKSTNITPSYVTSLDPLGYNYDDVSDPLANQETNVNGVRIGLRKAVTMSNSVPPQVVGITTNHQLTDTVTHIAIPTPTHTQVRQNIAKLAADPQAEHRVLLRLENLTATDVANSYDVYIHVPEGQDPKQYEDRFVARISLFGIDQASTSSQQHPGSGLTELIDITQVYHELAKSSDWDPANLRVSLVPAHDWKGATVNVGRVSVLFG